MFYVPHFFPLLTSSFQIHGFMKAPLRFMHLRNLIMNIAFGNVQRLGKNAVLQLAYLLEAAPFLVNHHVDVRFFFLEYAKGLRIFVLRSKNNDCYNDVPRTWHTRGLVLYNRLCPPYQK